MKTRGRKLLSLILGAGLLFGCSNSELRDKDKFGRLFFSVYDWGMTIGLDTDKDGYEDMKYYFRPVMILSENTCYLELMAIQEDKNRNQIPEEDEFIFKDENLDKYIKEPSPYKTPETIRIRNNNFKTFLQ